MGKVFFTHFCCCGLIFTSSLLAWEVGPEIYHMTRKKEGGSWQSGSLSGLRAVYERGDCGCYCSIDIRGGWGILNGRTASGRRIKSELSDGEIQGYLGYVLSRRPFLLIPYCGYSYLYSENRFVSPSPITYVAHNRLQSAVLGVKMSREVYSKLSVGVDFKAKYSFWGKSKISGDKGAGNSVLTMGNKMQYELNLPVRGKVIVRGKALDLIFEPFYRFRHYGGRENFPHYFFDTKFHIYGMTLFFNHIF